MTATQVPARGPRLGVNVDHVATVRQARRGPVPDPLAAALAAVEAGADGITAHLREDRRHIQDADIAALVRRVRLNLEMAATPEMIAVACGRAGSAAPHSVCLVPERRQELTTEGGLDVVGHVGSLTDAVAELKASGILVSLFIAPDPWQTEAAARVGADAVEFHTGAYAEVFAADRASEATARAVRDLEQAATAAARLGLRVHAGHGLDTGNVGRILGMERLEELNIGFSIVARALFVGMAAAVREMRAAMDARAAMDTGAPAVPRETPATPGQAGRR